MRADDHRAGVSRATSAIFRRSNPGNTVSRYSFAGAPCRRHDSMTERIAATFGPALALPTCSHFLRPSATPHNQFSFRSLDNSASA